MSGLSVEGLSVTYSTGTQAVVDASFAVAPGEIVSILGPSGSGKSSLLGAIVGILPIAAGRVSWDGEDLTRIPVHQRGFGLVFQDGQLFPHRTVAGNIAYGLEVARVPRRERLERVNALLAMVSLAGFGARSIGELSGGERQRVALARSLAPRPRLIALDEPFSSLDTELRGRLARDVRDVLHASGTAALLVTHDAAEAHAVSSRIVRIREGRVTP